MSWASRRRSIYTGIVVAIALVIVVPFAFFLLNKEPTCFDGKQNGQELGIDCGGICERLCEIQISAPVLIWSRSFKVADGVYNSVAYVENPNFNSGVFQIPYTFKLFDDKNLLIAERKGSTYMSPNSVTPIFEGVISTGQRIPVKTFFEFDTLPEWHKSEDKKSILSIKDIVLTGEKSSPRINAVLTNRSIETIKDIEVVAIVFDSKDNAIAVSSTFVERLYDRSTYNLVFTWPNAFDIKPSRIEIIPRIPQVN